MATNRCNRRFHKPSTLNAGGNYQYLVCTRAAPHKVDVTVTDGAGNTDTEEVDVNEPLNVVAPSCPTATPQTLTAGTVVSSGTAIAGVETALPSAIEPSQPNTEEVESEAAEEGTAISPAVTRNSEDVSLDEQGIDVVGSAMGGGIVDEAAGAFTVGQAACLEPLQRGSAASEPVVSEGNAVVFPNALPDTDTISVRRPSARTSSSTSGVPRPPKNLNGRSNSKGLKN
jgi:hypothetical protein